MNASNILAAVDLGATSGRVLTGQLDDGVLRLAQAHRFANRIVSLPIHRKPVPYWDLLALWQNVLNGLTKLSGQPVASIGVDGWGVDYGYLCDDGSLLGSARSYRYAGLADGVDAISAIKSAEEIYRLNGLQFQRFNTIYQLAHDCLAEAGIDRLASCRNWLLIPDLLNFWLTGNAATELTNASTTGLIDPETRTWSKQLFSALGEVAVTDVSSKTAELVTAGDVVGELNPSIMNLQDAAGNLSEVISVASHDTASAVAATPLTSRNSAYISCGTWSLVGVELKRPVVTEAARAANFTNELGVDGTVRFLKNVSGMWIVNECIRNWRASGTSIDAETLCAKAKATNGFETVLDVNSPDLFLTGKMPEKIANLAKKTGQAVPQTLGEFGYCIINSLALAHAKALNEIMQVTDRQIDVVHIVGGGCQNDLLCQLTADASGLPVVAGPIEASATGNLLVQARALRLIGQGLADMRRVVADSFELKTYKPKTAVNHKIKS